MNEAQENEYGGQPNYISARWPAGGYTRGGEGGRGVEGEGYDRNKRGATERLDCRFTGYAVDEIRGRRAFQMRMAQIGGEKDNPAWEQP
jgi:hypothetical protein